MELVSGTQIHLLSPPARARDHLCSSHELSRGWNSDRKSPYFSYISHPPNVNCKHVVGIALAPGMIRFNWLWRVEEGGWDGQNAGPRPVTFSRRNRALAAPIWTGRGAVSWFGGMKEPLSCLNLVQIMNLKDLLWAFPLHHWQSCCAHQSWHRCTANRGGPTAASGGAARPLPICPPSRTKAGAFWHWLPMTATPRGFIIQDALHSLMNTGRDLWREGPGARICLKPAASPLCIKRLRFSVLTFAWK